MHIGTHGPERLSVWPAYSAILVSRFTAPSQPARASARSISAVRKTRRGLVADFVDRSRCSWRGNASPTVDSIEGANAALARNGNNP